jgi:hypothetical protein
VGKLRAHGLSKLDISENLSQWANQKKPSCEFWMHSQLVNRNQSHLFHFKPNSWAILWYLVLVEFFLLELGPLITLPLDVTFPYNSPLKIYGLKLGAWSDSLDDETLPNSIKRKHPRKGEKKKQRASTKVQASKQPKRGEPQGGKGTIKNWTLQQLHEAYQLKRGEVNPIKLLS